MAADLAVSLATVRAEQQREMEQLALRKAIARETQATRQDGEIAELEADLALKLRRIDRDKSVAKEEAASSAERRRIEAEKMLEAEEARIASDRDIQLARSASAEATSLREIGLQSVVEAEEQKKRRAVEDARQEADKEIRLARLDREKTIALRQADQLAEIALGETARKQEADAAVIRTETEIERLRVETRRDLETARTQADEVVELARARRKEAVSQANIDADLAIDLHGIARSQSLTEQEHRRDIAIAESTKLQVAALADAETARLALVHAQGELERVREQEREEREQIVALIRARTAAERDTVAMLVQAEARFREAQDIAKANEVETRSKSDRLRALAEAEALAEKARLTAEEVRHATDAAGVRAMTEAENTMSEELMQLKLRLSVIDHLKDIIRESAKPMESISDIRIVQVDGVLGRGGLAGGGGGGEGEGRPAGGGGSLTDQVVDSALRYRAQAPVVDQLLADLGLKGPDSASVAGYLGGHMAATPRSETPDKG